MRRISSFVIVIGFVAAMPGLAFAEECIGDPNDPVKDVVSGMLSGTRNGHFICDLTNKSGETQECVSITLKKPDGSTLDGPVTCNSLAHGESCTLTRDITFPSLQEAAYCHAEIPKAFFRGSFRLEDQFENTIAESDMEFDLHGKLKELGEKIEQIPNSGGLVCTQEKSGNLASSWAGQNQSPEIECPEGQVAIAPGWEFNEPLVTVRKSFQAPGNPRTWKWQLRLNNGDPDDFAQVRILCCEGITVE